MIPSDAKFIFTALDRKLSNKTQQKIYRRVDSVRGAWKALFVAAGLAEPKARVPFTHHDMRRGFNLAAKNAGMTLEDRALILGHGKKVNETHYCGRPSLNIEKITSILNGKM